MSGDWMEGALLVRCVDNAGEFQVQLEVGGTTVGLTRSQAYELGLVLLRNSMSGQVVRAPNGVRT